MQEFTIVKSEEHVKDFGTMFLSKLRNETEDDLLGLKSQVTYYVWGSKQLSGTVSLNIEDYVIVERTFDGDPDEDGNISEITVKYIKAKK